MAKKAFSEMDNCLLCSNLDTKKSSKNWIICPVIPFSVIESGTSKNCENKKPFKEFPDLTMEKIKANIKLFEQKIIPYAEKSKDRHALQNMEKSVHAWAEELEKRRG